MDEDVYDERTLKDMLARKHSTTSKYASIGSATARRRYWHTPQLTLEHTGTSKDKLSRIVTPLETEHGLPAATFTISLDKDRRWEALQSLAEGGADDAALRLEHDHDRADRVARGTVVLPAVGVLDFSPGVDKASLRLHAHMLEIQRTFWQWPVDADLSTPDRWAALATPQGPRFRMKLKAVYSPRTGPPPEAEAVGSASLLTRRVKLSTPWASNVHERARVHQATVDARHDDHWKAFAPRVGALDEPASAIRPHRAHLDVDLGHDALVTHVSTRGRFPTFTTFPDRAACDAWGIRGRGPGPRLKLINPSVEWVTRYEVHARAAGGRTWALLGVFAGNTDGVGEVVHSVMPLSHDGNGVRCRHLRFVPLQWEGVRPAMRIGVYGQGDGSGPAGEEAGPDRGGEDGEPAPRTVRYVVQGAHALPPRAERAEGDGGEPRARFNRLYTRSQPRGTHHADYGELTTTAADFALVRGHRSRRCLARGACAPGGAIAQELEEDRALCEAIAEEVEDAVGVPLPGLALPTLGDAFAAPRVRVVRRRGPARRPSFASTAWSVVDADDVSVVSAVPTDDGAWSWTEADPEGTSDLGDSDAGC